MSGSSITSLALYLNLLISFHPVSSSRGATSGEILWMQGGHSWDITDLKTSADGLKLFSASADSTVKLWALPEGRFLRAYIGYTNIIRALAVNSAGTLMACGGDGGEVILWDVDSGSMLRRFTPHPYIGALAFTPDSSALLTATGTAKDPTMKLWSLADDSLINTFVGHSNWVTAVRFTPDGQTLISGSVDRTVRVWDVATAQLLDTYNVGAGFIRMDITPSGDSVAIGRTNILRLSTADWSPLPSLGGGLHNIARVTFSPDGKLLATGHADMTMRIWRTDTGDQLQTIYLPNAQTQPGLEGLVFSPDSKTIFSGGSDFEVKEWDVQTGNPVRTLAELDGAVGSVKFSSDHQTIAASSGTTVKIFNASDGNSLFALPHTNVNSIAYSSDGNYLVSVNFAGIIRVWNPKTGELIRSFTGHGQEINAVAFSPLASRFATASSDRTLKIWDIQNTVPLKTMGDTNRLYQVTYTKDGGTLITGDEFGFLRWWSISEGKQTNSVQAHTGFVIGLQLSPDGTSLASSALETDGRLKLWDVRAATLIRQISGPFDIGQSVFSPDGKMIAAGERGILAAGILGQGDLRVWRVSDGELLQTFTNETKRAWAVDWSQDGMLALGRQDGALITFQTPSTGPQPPQLALAWSANQVELSLTATAGQNIKIEHSTDLEAWDTHLLTTGTGNPQTFSFPLPSDAHQFFRAVTVP